jgi:RHS repeat-associated protein
VSGLSDSYDYDAFGNKINSTGTTPNNYLYRGEQFDSDLGMYYLRARYYNPLSGRFLSVDSRSGQGQRRYAYADADPVNGMDPSGNEAIIEFALLQFYPGRLPVHFPGFPSWCGLEMGGYLPGCSDGGSTGAPGGPPEPPKPCSVQTLLYNTVSGGQGFKDWIIQWHLCKPSKAGGWIVQKIADYNKAGKWAYTYWEAWKVPVGSKFTIYYPDPDDDTFRDYSGRRTDASARFYEGLQLPSSFIPNNPATYAYILPSTTVNPNLSTSNATAPVDRTWTAP